MSCCTPLTTEEHTFNFPVSQTQETPLFQLKPSRRGETSFHFSCQRYHGKTGGGRGKERGEEEEKREESHREHQSGEDPPLGCYWEHLQYHCLRETLL